MPSSKSDHSGLSLFLLEDSFLVGESIRQMLTELGCRVLGPVASLEDAAITIRDHVFDAALLDVNIRGDSSFGIAETLRSRACPVIFVTGYGAPDALPASLKHTPRLTKPVQRDALEAALRVALGRDRLDTPIGGG